MCDMGMPCGRETCTFTFNGALKPKETEMVIRVPESMGKLYERLQYPAGELQIRLTRAAIEELFSSKEVTVICQQAHKNMQELALLSDAIFHIKPFIDSTLALPYLPYSRADRRFVEGDCHGLKMFGEFVNRLRYHRVKTLDVHSFRAQGHVGNLVNVNARPFIAKAVADITDHGGHPIVLLPDEGAKRYNLDGALQASKKRDPVSGKLSGFEIPSELANKRDVLIVDDICDGGGTFIGLAERIKESQATLNIGLGRYHAPLPKLYLYVTHGIFSKGIGELLQYFERIYTTNSYCTIESWKHLAGEIEVFDCEPELLGGAQ